MITTQANSPREGAVEGVDMADESNDVTNEEAPETQPVAEPAAQAADQSPDDHSLKSEFRGAVAKAVGLAVEAGSMLSGYSGAGVSADREMAEADTEQFIDRIDGEG
jgi:hypothetical protein